MNNPKFYEIATQMQLLAEKLVTSGGEITEEQEKLLEELQEVMVKKTDGVAGFVRQQESRINAIDDEIERLQELKSGISSALDRFDQYVISCMERLGTNEIEGETSRLFIPKQRDLIEVPDDPKSMAIYMDHDPDLVTQEVIKRTKIDKKKIKDLYKGGIKLKGVTSKKSQKTLQYKTARTTKAKK